jgi:hypothetical protein
MKRFITTLTTAVVMLGGMAGPAFADPTPAPKGTPPAQTDVLQGGTAAPKGQPKDLKGGVAAPKGHHTVGGVSTSAACGSPSVCYTYDGVVQFVGGGGAGVGADAALVSTSQHKPFKATGDAHSLWEFAIESSNQQNIVEIGWTMDTAVCGQSVNPCLFVYHWVNGNNSCYNGCGWVDNPTEAVNAGTALATTAGGASPTVFYEYKAEYTSSVKCDDVAPVQTTAVPGWLMYQQNTGSTRLIGCFPATLWTGAVPSVTFDKVQVVQAFDETATADDHSCTDMGSGIFAPAAWGTLSASQWQKVYTLTNPPAGVTATWGTSAAISPSFNTPTAYKFLQQTPSGNELRLGGPGWNAAGTGTGSGSAC